jgi:hypothetical protein
MAEIIKTWPAFVDAKTVSRIFAPKASPFSRYYFTLGRGKPQHPVSWLWFTWRGRILGSFLVEEIVINDGTLPRLSSLSGEESEWQIKPDRWVAVCSPPCQRLVRRVYMPGFRGWRYFDYGEYLCTLESKVRLWA